MQQKISPNWYLCGSYNRAVTNFTLLITAGNIFFCLFSLPTYGYYCWAVIITPWSLSQVLRYTYNTLHMNMTRIVWFLADLLNKTKPHYERASCHIPPNLLLYWTSSRILLDVQQNHSTGRPVDLFFCYFRGRGSSSTGRPVEFF